MKFKKIVSVFSTLAVLTSSIFSAFPINSNAIETSSNLNLITHNKTAETIEDGAYTYRINSNGTATIVEYNFLTGSFLNSAPKKVINGYPVTSIAGKAFYLSSFTKFDIAENITTIEDGILFGAYGAFRASKVETVTTSENLEYIGQGAFNYCKNLNSITIKNPYCVIYDKEDTICNGRDDNDNYYFNGTIYGYSGSTAQEYAYKYGYNFVSIDGGEVDINTTPITTTTKKTTTTTTKKTTTTTTKKTTTTTTSAKFISGVNNWSFKNSEVKDYYISADYLQKLLSGLSRTEQASVKEILSEDFGGSCYGLSCTSILSCYGILEPAKYQEGANFLFDIDGPPANNVKSLINYYHALQVTDKIYQQTTNAIINMTEKEKIEKLIQQLEDDSPVLLTFFLSIGGGHAVVAYDIEYGTYVVNGKSYNAKIITYDNNAVSLNDNCCMYINTYNNSWRIPGYTSGSSAAGGKIGFTTDSLDLINHHGYLSEKNDSQLNEFISVLSSKTIASNYSLRKINMNSTGWAINAGSEDEIKSFSSFAGENENADIKFAITGEKSGCVMNLEDNEAIDMSMRYKNDLIGVTYEKASELVFHSSGYVELSGESSDYSISMISNDGYSPTDWFNMEVSGVGAKVNFKKAENGYILNSDNLKNVSLKAESDNESPVCTFSTEYPEVFIYEIDEKTIGVSVDKDNNGTYETTVSKSAEITAELGDVDNDGVINSSDASSVLKIYALVSTGDASSLTSEIIRVADINKDGAVDASDASAILQYYSYISTGGTKSIEDFFNKTA